MLSFGPAVRDCGGVSLSLSVSEPRSAADAFLLDVVVRETAFSPILMPFHNKTRESVAQCKLDFFVAENVTLTKKELMSDHHKVTVKALVVCVSGFSFSCAVAYFL